MLTVNGGEGGFDGFRSVFNDLNDYFLYLKYFEYLVTCKRDHLYQNGMSPIHNGTLEILSDQ